MTVCAVDLQHDCYEYVQTNLWFSTYGQREHGVKGGYTGDGLRYEPTILYLERQLKQTHKVDDERQMEIR